MKRTGENKAFHIGLGTITSCIIHYLVGKRREVLGAIIRNGRFSSSWVGVLCR